ncbi:MAG TPA: PEGA domain-containing protein [Candidatus Saccharimonadales bacterium]|jgi:hypothetical protein|nr:PEGA domain-containing protein [Candidatus Saccharimonadales bacterium]
MDFLDPKKRKAHTIRLILGYILVGIALIIATTILVYQSYGFSYKNGKVIQNGLVFLSSQPGSANIYMNGKLKDTTSARLVLPAGQYSFKLARDGYRPWQRIVGVEGGSVEHFDYPFLFPENVVTETTHAYDAVPNITLQSPDRHWLLVQDAASFTSFDQYDLSKKQPVPVAFDLPADLTAKTDGSQSWELVEWSTDNRHVLLRHNYQKSGQNLSEYILLDRQDPSQSQNLTKVLGTNPTQIALRDKAYDQYYVFDQAAGTLMTASLKEPTPAPYLTHVLDFKSYGSNVMLYATTDGASANQVSVKVRQGNDTFNIREVPANSEYLLDITQYSGDWYMAAGSQSENKVYVYKNPMATLQSKTLGVAVPVQALKVDAPNYVAFSSNAEFIMTENGTHFATYDVQTEKGYTYTIKHPLDAPQVHATWMDGDRIMYVSDGKVLVFDFDGINQQMLQAANPAYLPFFDRNYKYLYVVGPAVQTAATADKPAATQYPLTSTAMLTPKDQ